MNESIQSSANRGGHPFRVGTRGKALICLALCSLLGAAFFNGTEVSEKSQRLYSEGMQRAELMRDLELEADTRRAQIRLAESKTWSWWLGFDGAQGKVVERRTRELAPLEGKLGQLTGERQIVMTHARQQVGIWSEYGVSMVRAHFWDSMETSKNRATQMTKWDAFFMIIRDRDSTLSEIVVQLVIKFFINLVLYSIIGGFQFLFSVYGVISLFAPPALEGLAFFFVCATAAFAFIGVYCSAVVGGVVYAGYAGVKLLNNSQRQRQLHAQQQHQRQRQHQHRE